MFDVYSVATADLAQVKREMGHFAQWKDLGLNLGLSAEHLEEIQSNLQTASERLHDVLLHWLRRNYNVHDYDFPTWQQLAHAVDPINHALAINIRENHS